MTAVAVGKVVALDAVDPRWPGAVVITLICSVQQSRSWAQLLGDTVSAAPLALPVPTPPTEQVSVPKEPHK